MENSETFGLFGSRMRPVPLIGVDVSGNITGRGARVKIRQKFENQEQKPIEAVYKFPLPEAASVCGFRIIVGDRIVKGQVEEKEKAFALYDEALAKGHGGYLLDEERPNIFTLSVGNLQPNSSAIIEIEYVVLLDTNGADTRFMLPTTISPRYVPVITEDDNGIPVNDILNPPITLDVPYGIRIRLMIHGKEGIRSIESPTHTISTAFERDSIQVELSNDTGIMDRDFVLNIQYKENFRNRGFINRVSGESFVQVDLCPDTQAIDKTTVRKQEIVFLLDCSGSMGGSSIDEAKKALEVQLRGMQQGTHFNIYRFGSEYQKLFDRSAEYSQATCSIALLYLAETRADKGGTEILAPLTDILSSETTQGYERSIMLLTDGQVGNESEILSLVKGRGKGTRIFTVGIGNGPNEYFVKELARISGGTYAMIAPGERIELMAMRLFSKLGKPAFCNPSLNLSLATEQISTTAVVYAGECSSIFARVIGDKALPFVLCVRAQESDKAREWEVKLEAADVDSLALPVLWAREMIKYLERFPVGAGSSQLERTKKANTNRIIELSKKYGIISKETSFIGVEERINAQILGDIILTKVPVVLTREWGAVAYNNNRTYHRSGPSLPAYSRYGIRAIPPQVTRDLVSKRNLVSKKKLMSGPDLLLEILSCQQSNAGFILTDSLAKKLGISDVVLEAAINCLTIKTKADKRLLLFTAIVMFLLERDFAKDTWEDVTEKTRKWFETQQVQSQPTIEGVSLREWTAKLVDGIAKAREGA